MKEILRKIIPYKLLKFVGKGPKYGFFGEYTTWQEALGKSGNYDAPLILEKVKNSLIKVKAGEVAYERNSVTFDTIEYSWPLLAALLWIATRNNNSLNILDFGGSLGSSYYQNLNFLKTLKTLSWNIVEQKKFVDSGRRLFENEQLKFFYSVKECQNSYASANTTPPNTLLFASVIEYLEKPYEILADAISYNFKYIIFDRTSFLKETKSSVSNQSKDLITIQKIPPRIYEAEYPCWILNKKQTHRLPGNKWLPTRCRIRLRERYANLTERACSRIQGSNIQEK